MAKRYKRIMAELMAGRPFDMSRTEYARMRYELNLCRYRATEYSNSVILFAIPLILAKYGYGWMKGTKTKL